MTEVEIYPDLRHINVQESVISFDRGLQSYIDFFMVWGGNSGNRPSDKNAVHP